jgi:hypothetical protein
VAHIYLDHDLDRRVQPELQTLGHDVVHTRELRLERGDDATQLLTAARAQRVLVTHNERDYKLLQRAWILWPAPMEHSGILVVPQQRWLPPEMASRLDQFFRASALLTNELWWWTVAHGWLRFT